MLLDRRLRLALLSIPLLLIPLPVFTDVSQSFTDAFHFAESSSVTSSLVQIFDSFNLQEFILAKINAVTQSIVTVTQTITAFFTVTSNTFQGNPFIVTDTPLNALVSQIIVPAAIIIIVMLSAIFVKALYFSVVLAFGLFALLGLGYIGILPNWIPLMLIIFVAGGVVKVLAEVLK